MRIPFFLIALLSPISCTTAALVQPLARAPDAPSIAQHLQRRQVSIGSVSSAPAQCASSCGPVNDEINLGCPVTACCTTTFETQYYNCLECVGSAVDAGNYTTLQISLNLLFMTCVDMGFVLPRMALPGQSASNSTASVQPSSTGSGTSPASSGSSHATGAAVSGGRHGVQVEALVGISLLLWAAAVW